MISDSKRLQQEYRRSNVRVPDRRKQYLLFIDFAKAFDKVNRDILFEKMRLKGYNPQLIEAIRNLISKTWMNYQDENIVTEVGTP